MGIMGRLGRMAILCLALAMLASAVFPIAAASQGSEKTLTGSSETQYSPQAQFAKGVIYNNHSYAIQTDPWVRDFALEDLNDDGLQDVATIANNSILIYNRTSDNSLMQKPWRISQPGVVDLRSVAIGDLDRDGLNDIVVSSNITDAPGHLCIYYQSSGFNSSASRILPLSNPDPYQVRIAKLNGNGTSNNSIAVVCRGDPNLNYDDYVEIWKYPFLSFANDRRSHQITASPGFTGSELLCTGDINNDNKTDLVVGNRSGKNVFIMLQPSSWAGAWTKSTMPIDYSAADIQIGDVMGLGRADLAFASMSDSKVYVFKNTGTGLISYAEAPLSTYGGLSAIAIGEFSESPGPDILALSRTSGNASAFLMDALPPWSPKVRPDLVFPTNEKPLKAIVDRSFADSPGVFVLSQGRSNWNGSLEFFSASPSLSGNADSNLFIQSKDPNKIAVGTLANGNTVLATILPASSQIMVLDNDTGQRNFLSTHADPIDIVFGNFDGDSSSDIAVLNAGSNIVSIYPGSIILTENQPTKNISLPFSNSCSLAASSLRGTGLWDLLIGNDHGVHIMYNTGDTDLFRANLNETLGAAIPGERSVITCGSYYDPHTGVDVAVLNAGTNSVEIYPMTGNVLGNYYDASPIANLTKPGSVFTSMTSGDFGGNSYPDIAVVDESRQVLIYEQLSYGFANTPVPHLTIPLPDNGSRLSSGDLNDDGLQDLAIAYSSLPGIGLFLRSGDLAFTNSINFTSGGPSTGLVTKDINGDSRSDIGSVSESTHSWSTWMQNDLVPMANATANKYTANEGETITLSGALSKDSYSDQTSLQYNWTFDGSSHASGISVQRAFTDSGNHQVSLEVSDREGLSNWSNLTITVLEVKPIVNFDWTTPNPVEGSPVQFRDLSTPGYDPIASHNWNFGDGYFSSTQNPSHTYIQTGQYSVKLTVTDSDGTSELKIKTISIADTKPTSFFTNSPASIQEGGSVSFTDASTPGYDPIASRRWQFGDGGVAYNVTSIVHPYLLAGTYPVNLTVWDSDGKSDTYSKTIVIQDIPPVAQFGYEPLHPTEGEAVDFNDESTFYALDPILDWSWNFGDGLTDTGPTVSHIFTQTGDYLVMLTVIADDGVSRSTSKTVHVNDTKPAPYFTVERTEPIEGMLVYLNATSTGNYDPITYWNWTIDGVKRQGQNITFTFTHDGDHLVNLTATDSDHKNGSVQRTVNVQEFIPAPDFAYEPATPVEGMNTFFNASASYFDPIAHWNWSFSDEIKREGQEIVRNFSASGNYWVNLTITDSDGTMASINKTFTVWPSTPLASFSISPDPLEGATIWFNDTSWYYDPLVSWLWSFDDGTSNTSNKTTHILSDGSHSIRLTVTDSSGQSNFTVLQFSVSNSHPVASFLNTTAIEGALIYFNSTSTCSPFDQIDTINWSFGDEGPNATGTHVTHVYNRSGYFALTITVTDSDGMIDIRTAQIHVGSVLPQVSFAPSPGPYYEGREIWFNWTGSTTNWIKSFSWSFGDNSSLDSGGSVRHAFANNGTYRVTLTVVEGDDDTNTTFLDIVVADTNPKIISFRTTDARSVYNEDEEIDFIVYAIPTYEQVIRDFQFDLDFRSVFNGSLPLSPVNHTTHSYAKNGVYFVSVRAYDSDGFSQTSGSQVLRIEVRDPKPTAFFNFHNVSSGIVQFDASQSTDNPSDRSSLQYSWNFDDGKGYSAWNGTAIFNYHFSSDNAYNVTLLVRDDSGGISSPYYHQIVVDVTGPLIRLDEDVGAAAPGQVIAVKANITDLFGIGSVWLHYRVNNDSWVVTQMTAMGSLTQYEAQIPGQNDNTSIIYWIEAFDSSNNNRSTGEHRILVSASLVANPGGWYMWLILIAAGMVGFLLYSRSLTAAVDEIFVIYEDGRLIAHQTRRLKPGMDDEILSSMLIAIQSFVRDSFKDESGTHLQRLDFGEKKILVEKGEGIFIAVVLHGQRPGKVPQRMKQVIKDIEKEYGASLSGWDGDLEKVRGVKDATDRMFERARLLPNGRKDKPAN